MRFTKKKIKLMKLLVEIVKEAMDKSNKLKKNQGDR